MEKETYKNSREARYYGKIKRKKQKTINIIIAVVVVIAIVAVTTFSIISVKSRAVASSDYSAGLDENGFISGVNVADSVELCDYKNIPATTADIEVTDTELETEINSLLSAETLLQTDHTLTIADEDKVNIDYVGSIDGVEFDNGSTNGAGSDVTIGSGSLIDDFEEQLIGHAPGDSFVIQVTFPDPYTNNPDLAGKEASFEVTINGIYGTWTLTEEFIDTFYPEYGTTTEEFTAYVKNYLLRAETATYVASYIASNSKAKSYPSAYLKNVKSTIRYEDEATFKYYNQLYSYYGYDEIASLYIFAGVKTAGQYERQLTKRAKAVALGAMAMQAIYEECGLTMTDEDIMATVEKFGYTEATYDTAVETYSINYIKQYTISTIVSEYLVDNVTITAAE